MCLRGDGCRGQAVGNDGMSGTGDYPEKNKRSWVGCMAGQRRFLGLVLQVCGVESGSESLSKGNQDFIGGLLEIGSVQIAPLYEGI